MSHKIAIIVQAIDKATATLKSISGEVGNLGDKADSTAKDLQPLGTGLAAIGAAGAALITTATLTAARVEVLGTVLYTVGDNAGYTAEQLDLFEESLKAQGITTGAARQGLIQMMQAQLDLTGATDLARLAQDAGVIANKNSSVAYQDLITVIVTGRSVMAKSLGLVVDFNAAYREMAEQLGTTVGELTEADRLQARYNEVMAAGETIAGTYEAAMGDVGKKLTSMPRLTEEAALALGEVYLPAMEKVVDITSVMLEAFIALEPEQQEVASNFIVVTTGVAGLTGATILILPKLVAFASALGTVATFASETTFGLQLLAAGSNVTGLGIAGATAATIGWAGALAVAATPLVLLTAATLKWDEALEGATNRTVAASSSYEGYTNIMARMGRQSETLTRAQWELARTVEATGRSVEGAKQLTDGWATSLGNIPGYIPVNVHTTYTESGTHPGGGGYQHGTDYVPQTGWAYLHEGEAVLTKEENQQRGHSVRSSVVIHNHFGRDSVRTDEDLRYIMNTLNNQQRALELQGNRSRIS